MDCEEGNLVFTSIEFLFTSRTVTNVIFYSTFHGSYCSIFVEHKLCSVRAVWRERKILYSTKRQRNEVPCIV